MVTITAVEVHDVRFPTSEGMHGSDAMHPDPDYSAAYVVLRTDTPGLEGFGLTFTIGRGTEIVKAAVEAYAVHTTRWHAVASARCVCCH
jgi:L-fuconate dehydratase